jgi:hypothetical protein
MCLWQDICRRVMWHISCVLQTSHAYICLITDTSIVSYAHHTSTYDLSQTNQLRLIDITRLHMSYHRHINCVLQTSHAYICLVIDTSIVSYRHDTPTYVLLMCLWQDIFRHEMSLRHNWCVWQEICRRVMSVRHNWYVCVKTYLGV